MNFSTEKKSSESKGSLTGHLKSDDFFSVEKFNTSSFKITEAKSSNGTDYTITGNLTIKGITQKVSFPAKVSVAGKKVTATGQIKFDRTKFEIKFRSGSYFQILQTNDLRRGKARCRIGCCLSKRRLLPHKNPQRFRFLGIFVGTIKGITQKVSFPAKVSVAGKKVTATGQIKFDRTKFDIKYRSGSYFEDLADKMIYDEVKLDVKLVAAI